MFAACRPLRLLGLWWILGITAPGLCINLLIQFIGALVVFIKGNVEFFLDAGTVVADVVGILQGAGFFTSLIGAIGFGGFFRGCGFAAGTDYGKQDKM